MDWRDTINVSKLDAARRQIDTAVRLYFDYGDPVAIHTLAAAGFQILHDLDKHGPNTGTFYDDMAKYFGPKYRETVIKTIRQAQTFFKHADRDPEAVLEFSLAEPQIVLLGACQKFRDLGGYRSGEMGAFLIWSVMQNPDMFAFEEAVPVPAEFNFQSHQRREFFAAVMRFAGPVVAALDGEKLGS